MLGDFINFTKGFAFKSSSFVSSGIKIVKVGNLNSNMSESSEWYYIDESEFETYKKYQIKDDDVIVSTVGSWKNNPNSKVGKACIFFDVKERLLLNQNAVIIRTNNNEILRQKYLKYLVYNKAFGDYIIGCAQGSANQASITLNDIRNFRVEIPDVKIQDKIVSILDSIILKINLNNKINNNLHELERNLYKDYFMDLDDTNTQKLGELCKIKYGKGLPTTKIEKEGYPVYGGNGIIGYYHEFMYDNSQVLISCRGASSGNVIVSKPKSFVTNNSLILECDRKYHYYLKQYSLDNYYYEYTTGSAQPQITIDNIKDIVLSIPSDELLESFNKQMENLELKYFSNLEEISKLEQLRDILLPKLMNGEIDLDNIEI